MSDDDECIDLHLYEPQEEYRSPPEQTIKTTLSLSESNKQTPVAVNLPLTQPKNSPLKMQPSDLKVNDVDEQEEINLSDSFEKFNEPAIKQYDSFQERTQYKQVGMSIHMESEEFKTTYLATQPVAQSFSPPISTLPPMHPKSAQKPKQKQNSNEKKTKQQDFGNNISIDQSINKSVNQRIKPSPKSFFTKKKEPMQTSSSSSNKTGMGDSALGFQVPTPNKLVHIDNTSLASSKNSASSLQSNRKSAKKIEKFEVQSNTNEVTFYLSDLTMIKKTITEFYLEYLEKYFFYHFNVLLPMHINDVFDNNSALRVYIQIYFEFIRVKHPNHLLQFLEKSNFKPQQQKPESSESKKGSIKDKLFEYKNLVIDTLYTGKDMVQNAVKKLKGETVTPVRLLERIFFKQIELAQKQLKARERLQNVTGVKNIHSSIYQKGGADLRNYVLMCLRWLLGFELTMEMIKEKQGKSDPVENEKLEILLNEFTIEKEKQHNEKMKVLQVKVKSIYSQ